MRTIIVLVVSIPCVSVSCGNWYTTIDVDGSREMLIALLEIVLNSDNEQLEEASGELDEEPDEQ